MHLPLFKKLIYGLTVGSCLLLGANSGTAPIHAQNPLSGTEIIRLKNISPSFFVATIAAQRFEVGSDSGIYQTMVPKSVEEISPNELTDAVTVRGSSEDIEKIRGFVRVLDVPTKHCRLHIRIFRVQTADFSRRDVLLPLAIGDAEVSNNGAVTVPAYGAGHYFSATLTPHINGDGSVSMQTQFAVRGRSSAADLPMTPLVADGQVRLNGRTKIIAPNTPTALLRVAVPANAARQEVYELQVTAHPVEPASSRD